jgi:hypothetical protein
VHKPGSTLHGFSHLLQHSTQGPAPQSFRSSKPQRVYDRRAAASPARIVWKDYQQHPEKQPIHINTPVLASIGIDIGKEVFHIVGFGADGKIAFRCKIKRLALLETFKKLSPCVVGMEACLSAHFVSRTLRQLGHHLRIIPAIY